MDNDELDTIGGDIDLPEEEIEGGEEFKDEDEEELGDEELEEGF